MNRISSLAIALGLGVLVTLAGSTRADEPAAEGQRAKLRIQVRTGIEQKLAAASALDAATAARMAALIDRSDDQVAAMQRDNHAAYVELKQSLAAPSPDVNAINRLTDRMLANRAAIQRNEEERLREIRRLLTPVQFGKLVIAYPVVNQQIRAGIRKALMERSAAVDDQLGE